ncbi:DUF416 family protein, partial [Pontibacter sp. JAM-7]|uniref:DUF416 family protein n=1 Tax=Pontibacter sp. JAM-7 TaxID=3366581 RepID=UPI003AF7A1C0
MTDQVQNQPLGGLQDWQLLALAAAITERMYPNFALFSRLLEFGELDRVRRVIDGVWDAVSGTGAKMNFDVQLPHIEQNIPDLEEFDMYGAIPARDAILALCCTLNTAIQPEPSEVDDIIQLSRETVAGFIELNADDQLSDEELVRLINTHDLMLQEDDFLADCLELLVSTQSKAKVIQQLRALAANDGYSN